MDNNFRAFVIFVVITSLGLSSIGCEPIRKKFIRQKKKDTTSGKMIPVLEPELYPSKENDPYAAYVHHYNLFKLWIRDLNAVLEAKAATKKQQYVYTQALKHLDAMANILDGKNAEDIAQLRKIMEQIKRVLFETPGVRPDSAARDYVRLTEKFIYKNLKPDLLEDSFPSRPVDALP